MKRIFIIILYSFSFTFAIQSNSKESAILYLWEISDSKVWKKFGDDETQQKYNGEIKYGKPHGLGITIFLNGTKYLGKWKNGEKHGQGELIFPDGSKLSGEWQGNQPWNVKRFDTNDKINDEYIEGVKQINNKIEGILFFRKGKDNFGWFETGDEKKDYKYVGEIENGKPNGWGKFTYPSGYIYEGQYKEGKAHGKGSFSSPNGEKGFGQFRENKPWNITQLDNDSKIIGKYVEGIYKIKEKQIGVLFTRKEKDLWIWFESSDGPYSGRYEGQIENGKPEGQGTLTFLNGTKYVGEYKNGTWNGHGIFYFPGGEKWEGEFKDDSPWNIIWYDKFGKILEKWENGIKQKIKL